MEMGLLAGTFVMSALSALCSVAALVVLLVMAEPKEKANVATPAEKKNEKPPDDVEKRRRAAVNAKEHSNFMDYDGTPQQPIDPSLILADGG
jgi:hypothetical protein